MLGNLTGFDALQSLGTHRDQLHGIRAGEQRVVALGGERNGRVRGHRPCSILDGT